MQHFANHLPSPYPAASHTLGGGAGGGGVPGQADGICGIHRAGPPHPQCGVHGGGGIHGWLPTQAGGGHGLLHWPGAAHQWRAYLSTVRGGCVVFKGVGVSWGKGDLFIFLYFFICLGTSNSQYSA